MSIVEWTDTYRTHLWKSLRSIYIKLAWVRCESKFWIGYHMSVAEWIHKYGINHWMILRSSYRKLAWLGFELPTSEFYSDVLTKWASKQWLQLEFHLLLSVIFHFSDYLRQSLLLFLIEVESTYAYRLHLRTILRSSYRRLAWVRFEPTTTEFRSDALTNWAIRLWFHLAHRANLIHLLQLFSLSNFILGILFVSRDEYF